MTDIDKFFKQPWAITVGVIGGLVVIGGLGKYLNREKDTGFRDFSTQHGNRHKSIWWQFENYKDRDTKNSDQRLSPDAKLGYGVKKSRRKRKSLVRGSKKKR
jgi:hypothetical protein